MDMQSTRRRRPKVNIEQEAMRIYMEILREHGTTPTVNTKPRSNAVPVLGKPVAACASQPWLRFNSQTAAKQWCFGVQKAQKLNTSISYCIRSPRTTTLGWWFKVAT